MSRFAEQVKSIAQTLELQSIPIGVRFSESRDGQGVERQLRICEALDVVRQEHAVVARASISYKLLRARSEEIRRR